MWWFWNVIMPVCVSARLHAQDTPITIQILMRTVFTVRCWHAQQLREYSCLHVNQHFLNTPETRLVVGVWCHDVGGQANWFSHPIQINEANTLFSFSHCLALLFWFSYIAVWWHHLLSLIYSTVEDENMSKWPLEAWDVQHTLVQQS